MFRDSLIVDYRSVDRCVQASAKNPYRGDYIGVGGRCMNKSRRYNRIKKERDDLKRQWGW
jgi:hypothetical protein